MSQIKPREPIIEEPQEPAILQDNPFRAQEEASQDYNIFKEFQPTSMRVELNKRVKP